MAGGLEHFTSTPHVAKMLKRWSQATKVPGPDQLLTLSGQIVLLGPNQWLRLYLMAGTAEIIQTDDQFEDPWWNKTPEIIPALHRINNETYSDPT